jgi:hypothetical protein
LPPALSAKDIPGERPQILNVRRIRTINLHPVESDEDSAPESISDTKDWLNWNVDLEIPNDSNDNCAVDIEFEREHSNGIEDPECPEERDGSAVPNVPGSIRPTQMSNRQAEKLLVTVNIMETRRNKGVKNQLDRMHQCFTSLFMYFVREC